MPRSPVKQDSPTFRSMGARLSVLLVIAFPVVCLLFLPQLRDTLRSSDSGPSGDSRTTQANRRDGDDTASPGSAQGAPTPLNHGDGGLLPERSLTTGIKTIRRLPRTNAEVRAAHDKASRDACQYISSGEPIQLTGYSPFLTRSDLAAPGNRPTLLYSRRHVISVGLSMLEQDRRALPTLSRGEVVGFLRRHYLSVQVRICKDPLDGALSLHHRPLGGVGAYGSPLSQDSAEALAKSMQDYRSLGLWVKSSSVSSPQHHRTLVLLYKDTRSTTSEATRGGLHSMYEYMFVRARPGGDELQLHTLATTKERKLLHHLSPCPKPSDADQCSIASKVCFTEFSRDGLVPTASATRSVTMRSSATYPMASLHDYATAHGWDGDALDNLSATLDAIIDGKIATSGVITPGN